MTALDAVTCCAPLGSSPLTDDEAQATADVFRALADPARVRIVNLLATSGEPVCVCDLVEPLGISQPTVSHHLKKLLDAGLVDREQRGKWACFSINAAAVRSARPSRRPERSLLLMTTTADELREEVRRHYAEAALKVKGSAGGCGSGSCCEAAPEGGASFGEALYDAERRGVPTPRHWPRSDVAIRQRLPICTKGRSFSTSAPEAGSTSSCRPSASAPAAGPTAST